MPAPYCLRRISRRTRLPVVLSLALGGLLVPAAPLAAQANSPLEELQAMAEDQTAPPDLARAALLAARVMRPDVDPAAYQRELDRLAAGAMDVAGGTAGPLETATALAGFLYGEEEFANTTELPADVFVGFDQVLDKKQWNCVGMALLYTALGDRLGLPLQVVSGRGHVLVAWNAEPRFFIETTAGGALEPSRNYLIDYLPFPCVNPDNYEILGARDAVAMALSQMALAMQRDERVQLAEALFSLAIDFSDTYAEAHAGHGFLKAAAGDHTGAIADFERALELDPDLREALGGLGSAHRARGNLTRAVEHYRELLALCPDDSAAVFNAGQLRYETDDFAGAAEAFRHYTNLEPNDPEGYMRLAIALEDGGNLEAAARVYREILQRAPNYADAALNLAYILEQMRNFEASMEGYRRVLDLRPGDARAMGGIGRVYGKVNRYDEALRAFRGALDQYPGAAFLWVDLGELFENAGEPRQALAAYQEAINADPTDPENYHTLARLLQQVGLVDDARNVRTQARAVEAEIAAESQDPARDEALPADPGMEDLFPAPEEREEETAAPDSGTTPATPPGDGSMPENGSPPAAAPGDGEDKDAANAKSADTPPAPDSTFPPAPDEDTGANEDGDGASSLPPIQAPAPDPEENATPE